MFITENSIGYGYSDISSINGETSEFIDPIEESIYNMAIDEDNYNQILKSIAIAEVTAASQGLEPESIYTEGMVGDFWEKIKEFFKKLWAKIKGLWSKLIATVDAQFRSGESFFEKYKKTLADKFSKIDKDDIKFSGYEFTGLGNKTSGINLTTLKATGSPISWDWGFNTLQVSEDNLNKLKSADNDAINDIKDEIRGIIIEKMGGTKGSYSPKEFTKELKEYLWGDKDNDIDVDYAYIQRILYKSDKTLNDVKKYWYKNVEKELEKLINNMNKMRDKMVNYSSKNQGTQTKDIEWGKIHGSDTSKITSDDQDKNMTIEEATSAYSRSVDITKDGLNSIQTAGSMLLKACKAAISQAKGFAAKVLRASVSKGYKESTSYYNDSNSVFGSVKFA